jgi:hypothetical protein
MKKATRKRTPRPPRTDDDYNFLNRARFDVLELSRSLYGIGSSKRISPRSNKQAIFENLVGATFSLWRAVFYIYRSREKWAESLKATTALMKRILDDNAVTYAQEAESWPWFGRYYLKAAEQRVLRAWKLANKPTGIEGIASIERGADRTFDHGPDAAPGDRWSTALSVVRQLVDHLRTLL